MKAISRAGSSESNPIIRVSHILALLAGVTLIFNAPSRALAEVESQSDWSEPSSVTIPSDRGPVQAILKRIKFNWRDTDQTLIPHEISAVIIPSRHIYWLGESGDPQLVFT
jgi:hypothetical protein